MAARRLDDGARAAFSGDYFRGHITHGYAVTMHSAQGVTADTIHAVLGENTTRALLYVAMTRGRGSNTAYLRAQEIHRSRASLPSSPVTENTCRRRLFEQIGAVRGIGGHMSELRAAFGAQGVKEAHAG